MRRKFTPEQANRTLPLVRRIVGDILETLRSRERLLRSSRGADQLEELESQQQQLNLLLEELESLGCYYKSWNDGEFGLVDFPAEIDGKEVLLCWKSDEDSITHFHDYERGFAGRRPIPRHLLARLPEETF